MEVTNLASVLAEQVKNCVVGAIGYRPRPFAVQELVAEAPMVALASGSDLVCVGKAIFNESSAVEEFRDLSDELWRLEPISRRHLRGYVTLQTGIKQVQEWLLAAYQSRVFEYVLEGNFGAFESNELHHARLGYLGLPSCNICRLPSSVVSLSALLPLDLMVPETIHDAALGWHKKISAAGNKMTIETSSKGGFDIEIGSYTVYVPKYSSVHHPLIQMVLFSRTLYDSTLRCLKLVAPKSIVEFNESGQVITKTKSHSPNTVSARKDVHVHADTAPENHSITPGIDKNIPKFGELDYNVDLSTVPVHSGGFALENVYNLHSLTSAPSFADHGITKAEEKTEDWRLANITKAEDDTDDWRLPNIAKAEDNAEDGRLDKVTWLMATAAVHHATGIRDLLSGFTTIKDLFVKAGDGVSMPVCGRGSVTGTVVLQDVWFVPGLTENLVSVTQLTELDYSVGFSRAACIIKSATDDAVIGKAHVSEDGLFEVDFLKVGPVI